MNKPYDFQEAKDAARRAAVAQKGAEDFMREASRDAAIKEEAYRVALAERIVELRAEGVAATTCGDLARGDKTVARLKRERDIAEGVRDAAVQAAWRHAADRRDVEHLIAWSMRRDLAEGNGPDLRRAA